MEKGFQNTYISYEGNFL